MRKINIFQVNGVWQLGRLDQADEEDLKFDKEDIQASQPEPAIPNQTKILIQIWGGMQNIQESMRNLNTHFNKVE